MFEFHGWASIEVEYRDDPDPDIHRARLDAVLDLLRSVIREKEDNFSLFEIRTTSNGLAVLIAHGLRNHRYQPVVDLFRWMAAELPFCYGLLYVRDGEDDRENCKYDNEFRAWRLALGELRELDDPFLSPCIPTIELPL